MPFVTLDWMWKRLWELQREILEYLMYGKLPKVVHDNLSPEFAEVGYCLYMPISVPGRDIILPMHRPDLRPVEEIVLRAYDDDPYFFKMCYVYLTFKRMIVGPTVTPNRPGWHADGFGTDDINYVWYDCLPTVFNTSDFKITPNDHIKSLAEFEAQALPENDAVFPNRCLLKLDPYVVHKVQLAQREMMRTFVKISVSRNQYNLKGNSTNPFLSTGFRMYDRALVRNDPHKAQQDFYNP
jgi:hypothetical protein